MINLDKSQSRQRSFREKVLDGKKPVLIYTLIPPARAASSKAVDRRIEFLIKLQNSVSPDAINIPEVRDESRNPRITRFEPKWAPREFAAHICRKLEWPPEIIIDRNMVETHWGNQLRWLNKTAGSFEVDNIVLVGGESSKKRYPGPAVPEAARRISGAFGKKILLGGITIPSRAGEAGRLLEKTRAGIQYFISQVLCEARLAKSLLLEYRQLTARAGIKPGRIFLSFAPLTSKQEIEFLRWWDVAIPSDQERYLLSEPAGTLERSIKMAESIASEIMRFVRDEQIDVPLGLNIEHLSTRNLEASLELASRLAVLYK